jgi:SAM-dependent methyltransferase
MNAPEMTEYTEAFYDDQERQSLASARVVLDQLFAHYHPTSVVDIGCGLGTWLAACTERGATDILGIDGAHVNRRRLHIPSDRFLASDLSRPLGVDRRFELAISLEVSEHLPGDRANSFVAELTALADVVLFSAALPYQGGTGHVNENWPEYWADKFRKRGYVLVDLFRPVLWHDQRVAFWYRQNTFLYVRAEQIGALGLAAWRLGDMPLSSVHPELLLWVCARARGIGNAFERDRTYWNDAVHAYQSSQAIAEHESGYGREHQVRFGGIGVLRRLKSFLR